MHRDEAKTSDIAVLETKSTASKSIELHSKKCTSPKWMKHLTYKARRTLTCWSIILYQISCFLNSIQLFFFAAAAREFHSFENTSGNLHFLADGFSLDVGPELSVSCISIQFSKGKLSFGTWMWIIKGGVRSVFRWLCRMQLTRV